MKDFFEKLKAFFRSVRKKAFPLSDSPIFWCAFASLLLCSLVLVIVIAGHGRFAGDDPIQGISEERSMVLDKNVAQMYAQNQPASTAPAVTAPAVTAPAATAVAQSTASPSPSASPVPITTQAPNATVTVSEIPAYQWTLPDFSMPTALPSQAPANTAPPQIFYSIAAGETVSQPVVLMDVQAVDNGGGVLPEESLSVTCNGNDVLPRYTSGSNTTYSLSLNQGANDIVITAVDAGGGAATLKRTVTYNIPQAPVVTVSVEATTAGYGYLVPPTAVALENGRTVDYYVTKLLTQYGYTYTCEGSVGQSFFLTSVGKAGAFAHPAIPDDLKDNILSDPVCGPAYNEEAFQPDNLSSSCFVPGQSGWMYSLNEQYQAMGMSMVLPSANDYIRVRYTLANGKDIGNSFNLDGAYNGWEKEW